MEHLIQKDKLWSVILIWVSGGQPLEFVAFYVWKEISIRFTTVGCLPTMLPTGL